MKRLLSLNSYHYRRGGSDAVYFNHAELFQNCGWETAYFAMHHPLNEQSEWNRYFCEEIEFGNDYGLLGNIKRAGRIVYSPDAAQAITKLIHDFRPSVAHAHCIYHHLSPSVLRALKRYDIPTVMTAHDLKLACPAYKMMVNGKICEQCRDGGLSGVVKNRCIRDSLAASAVVYVESSIHKSLNLYERNLDRIIAPSRFFERKLAQWGTAKDKITYIPNYVDVDKAARPSSPGKNFLYFGRLAPEKGIDTLIRAASDSGISVDIAGTGPEHQALQALAHKLDAPVNFLGRLEQQDMREAINNSRATLLPARWYENAPMAVLESMAAGRIVIASEIGGITELIDHGETGFLHKPDNVSQLASLLTKVSNMADATLAEMGQHAIDSVAENFNKERYVDLTMSVYRDIDVRA